MLTPGSLLFLSERQSSHHLSFGYHTTGLVRDFYTFQIKTNFD